MNLLPLKYDDSAAEMMRSDVAWAAKTLERSRRRVEYYRDDAPSTMIHLRAMTDMDIPLGMRLSAQAGWNQVEADWKRFLQMQPDGCFVAEWDRRAVGTTTTCIFDSVGWIAMVLVDNKYRHRGIGTRLVQHALQFLDRRRVETARLDATALGRPVYERLGFIAEYDLMRMEGVAVSAGLVGTQCHKADDRRLNEIIVLDQRVTGTQRDKLLSRLLSENAERSWLREATGKAEGYAISRPGSRAAQIGPSVAFSEAAGRELLDRALDHWHGQQVYVDVPCDNRTAVCWSEERGLLCQRSFTRMFRGHPVPDDTSFLWASSGPEKG